MTPLEYTKGLKSVVFKFEFENGHTATVVKASPHDLFTLTSDVEFIGDKNLTNIGVRLLLDNLASLKENKDD